MRSGAALLDAIDGARNISGVEQEFQPAGTTSPGTLAIDRAAQLLTLVLEAERPCALGELAGDLELPKSTASRLLGALERQGLVEQRGRRGRFSPGPVLIRFAHRGAGDRHLAELAEPHLETLGRASGETINLAVPGALGVEHIAQVESTHFLGAGQWVGRRVPYPCSAVGKVLVAFGAADLPELPLDQLTPSTIVEKSALAAALRGARVDRCAEAVDELEVGLASLAAPVLAGHGDAVATLSISGPTARLDRDRREDLRPLLINEAEALGARLGEHEKGVRAA